MKIINKVLKITFLDMDASYIDKTSLKIQPAVHLKFVHFYVYVIPN